jgi:hypothetical protein
MAEVMAAGEGGRICLPPDLHLPDGLQVCVCWEEGDLQAGKPYEREEWTETDVR